MPARLTPDPKRIEELQAEAARNPTRYRWKLGTTAVAGDVALTALQVLPFALPIWIGMSFYNFPYQEWAGAVVLVFLVWLVRPSIRFHGRELKREEAPRLFSEIDAVRSRLRAPGRLHVVLDDSFNASAAESRGVLGLIGTRCALTLGIPLLAAFSREQMLAVIAHEFGHFSRRHGRLGHWLYRARVGWLIYASDVTESDSALDRAMAVFARRFVPYFSTLSFVESRQCEYEADADAASVAGSKTMATALTRLATMARLWGDGFPRHLGELQQESPEPPADFYERFSAAARTWPESELRKWLDDAMRTPSGWKDTHPSLAERLASLQEKPQLGELTTTAGSELLGDAWKTMLAEFNAKWLTTAKPHWIINHLHYKHVLRPLLANDGSAVKNRSPDARLAWAKALRATKPVEGLAELRALHTQYPEHRGIAFAYAAALLRENDSAGAALMERLVQADPTYRAPGYPRLAAYYERRSDPEQAELSELRGVRAAERRSVAVSTFMAEAESGRSNPSTLPP